MAVGITKYYGAGSRPMIRPTNVVTEDEFTFDPAEGGTTTLTSTSTSGSGGSALTGKAALIRAQTARQQAIAEQNAAADAVRRAQTGAANQLTYLQALSSGVPQKQLDLLAGQKAESEGYVNKQYDTLMKQLGEAYGRGEQITTTGYNALRDYLTKNQPQAFAQATRATPTAAANDLAAYMRGQGVSTTPVEPTIAALNAAAQGGAQNYNQLLNTLAAAQASGQESRLAEEQMARTLAAAQLGQLRASQEGSLQQQQLAALAQIQAEQAAARLQLEQQAAARQQAIEDAIAGLVGTGYVCPPGKVKDANGNCVEPPPVIPTFDPNNIDPAILAGLANFQLDLGNIGGFVGSL